MNKFRVWSNIKGYINSNNVTMNDGVIFTPEREKDEEYDIEWGIDLYDRKHNLIYVNDVLMDNIGNKCVVKFGFYNTIISVGEENVDCEAYGYYLQDLRYRGYIYAINRLLKTAELEIIDNIHTYKED